MKRAHVLGVGKSGRAAIECLQSAGYSVSAYDEKICLPNIDWASFPKQTVDFVVISPGIPMISPLVRRFIDEGIPLLSEIELGARYLNNKMIAVTGTNGKSTFCTQLAACIPNALPVGNIGYPLSACCNRVKDDQTLVVELSSFQLELLNTLIFDRGVILEITPDHLDRYLSFESYKAAKLNLFDCVKEGGEIFVHETLESTRGIPFSQTSLLLKQLAKLEGGEIPPILPTLPHRLEEVATIEQIRFINDSKGTNIASVIYAIGQYDQEIVLMCGGKQKGEPLSSWEKICRPKVRHVVLFGESAQQIASVIEGKISFSFASTVEDGVRCAKKCAHEGNIVLFSPGCASFDQFSNFEQRGDAFKTAVKKIMD